MDRVDYAFPPQRMPSYNQPGLSLPPRFQQQQHHHHHPHLNPLNTPEAHYYSPRPAIDADVLAAGVHRYIPSANRPPAGFPHSNSYISLPPGVDPATVDFRTFYPYNPSEVKHRKRTTRTQLKVLEETFKKETKPNAALRKQLASQLDMTPRGVQVRFYSLPPPLSIHPPFSFSPLLPFATNHILFFSLLPSVLSCLRLGLCSDTRIS